MTSKVVSRIRQLLNELPHSHRVLISAISATLFLLLVIPSEPATASKNSKSPEQLMPGKRYQLDLAFESTQAEGEASTNQLSWQSY